MEFKGTKGEWKCIFTSDLKRAIRTNGGILMTFLKPTRYSNQDERYEQELKETQANQLLCSKAPEMLEMLKETIIDLKILRNQILDASKTNHLFEGMPELIDNWISRKEQLIKEATEI